MILVVQGLVPVKFTSIKGYTTDNDFGKEVKKMASWAFWLVVILLAILVIISGVFALREFRKNKKLGNVIIHYILLVVLTIIILKLLYTVSALALPF
ncbi:MAG: hypothetical protein ACETVO_00520 [bacterium]